MSIQPINSVSFKGKERTTEKGNSYKSSNIGTNVGIAAGIVASGFLMRSQLNSLKTIKGKRNLIAGFREAGKSLNDVLDREVVRDANGKILSMEGKVSPRTKKIVSGFKTTLAIWGAGITAVSGLLGKVVDTSINSSREKRADGVSNPTALRKIIS